MTFGTINPEKLHDPLFRARLNEVADAILPGAKAFIRNGHDFGEDDVEWSVSIRFDMRGSISAETLIKSDDAEQIIAQAVADAAGQIRQTIERTGILAAAERAKQELREPLCPS